MVNYKDAGVDVDAFEDALDDIKKNVASTFTPDVVQGTSMFKLGGNISLKKLSSYKDPVLVLTIDGVGTKMTVAEMANAYDKVGADIVNHGINDILTSGAKPMFFLDYVASSSMDMRVLKQIVQGVAAQCKRLGIILAGGETAEMPGVYHEGKYDLAGTMGGIVERDKIIDGSKVKDGNVLLGLASNGLHTNGYSLARKIFFEDNNYKCEDVLPEIGNLGTALMQTHREYASSVLPLVEKGLVNGIAHITGGGFPGNIPRVLPPGLGARISVGSWDVLPIFNTIQKLGRVNDEDMYKTFNMGIGLVLVVDREKKDEIKKLLANEKVHEIGEVIAGKGVQYANH